jgi:hypothetical protein
MQIFLNAENLNLYLSNLIQYKKVVVPGNDQNTHALNAAIWQK